MSLIGEHVLLRVYLQSADRTPHMPTSGRVVAAARKEGLAGATVLHGILGAGYHGILKPSAWSLVQHVPVVVEIVDQAARIARFLEGPLDRILIGGMVTLERAAVMVYRAGPAGGMSDSPLPSLFDALRPLSTMPFINLRSHMNNENGILLRVFIGESDRFEGKPLYEAIVQRVRELGMAGATVLRGIEGFGAHSVVHKAMLLEMSADLPIVIEIVDTDEKIRLLLPHLEGMVREGMITMEYVMILLYRHARPDGATTGSGTEVP